MKWRWFLLIFGILFGVVAWFQQKRAADTSTEATNSLQKRLDSMDIHIGDLRSNTPIQATDLSAMTPFPKDRPTVKTSLSTLLLAIDGANISVPEAPTNSTSLALITAVKNMQSVPSVATDYALSVITPDKVKHEATFIRLGNKGELRWTSVSGNVTVIPASEALEDKTENREIVGGGVVRGQLLFLLPGVPHDQVIDPETKLILSAQDATGKRSVVQQTIREISRR